MRLVWSAGEAPEGCLGSHGWQLKCQRDISVARGSPREVWGLIPCWALQSTATEPEGTQMTSRCEKWQDSCLPGRNSWRHRRPLKGPRHKILFVAWAPTEGGQSGLETFEESLGLVSLGRELREQRPASLCWVTPYTAEAICLRQRTPLWMASAWGEVEAIAPPTGITLPHPVVLTGWGTLWTQWSCCWLQTDYINEWSY